MSNVSMNSVTLLPVTSEMARWKDLDIKSQNTELALRIGLIVGSIVLVIGIVLATYICCTTASGVSFRPTNAVWSILPFSVGLGALPFMIWGIVGINFDRARNGRSRVDLTEDHNQLGIYLLLKDSSLSELYAKYYKHFGGITRLVNHGFCNAEQGWKLRENFKEYHEALTCKNNFEKLSRVKAHIDNVGAHVAPLYEKACATINKLEAEYVELQGEIVDQLDTPQANIN